MVNKGQNISADEQLLLYHDLIDGIVTAMEARDPYISCHSMCVAEMTETLCSTMGLSEQETRLCHIYRQGGISFLNTIKKTCLQCIQACLFYCILSL